MKTSIRSANPSDRPAILNLVQNAFTNEGNNGDEEVDIVETTWAVTDASQRIELVAVRDDEIIGHVLAGVGDLRGTPAIGIAPLSVSPHCQSSGVGSLLMETLLERLKEQGWPFALLLGNPDYYGRFGFKAVAEADIVYPPAGPSPAFQICILGDERQVPAGDFIYCFEKT